MSIFNLKKNTQPTEPVQAEPTNAIPEESEQQAVEEIQEEIPAQPSTAFQCQTSAHLTSYPLIKETVEFIDEIPGVKAVKSTTNSIVDPAVQFVVKQPLINPVVKSIDGLGDKSLSTIESITPCVKSATYSSVIHTIEEPFVKTDEALKAGVASVNNAIDETIITPTINLIHDSRAYYNEHLYDTKGKPLLRSSLDPIFRPINKSIENFAEKHLPEAEPLSEEYSSEIGKNVHLTANVVHRSIPVVHGKIIDAAMVPCNYTKHVVDVFNDNLAKQEERSILTSSVAATYNSSKELAGEAWSETVGCLNKTFGTSVKTVGEVEVSATTSAMADPIEATNIEATA